MQANPDKFQAISVGRKTHEKNLSFMLHFLTKSKISFIKILNITGPRMDPWGTPLYISRKELQTDPILTHCNF
jgi:hypothetical protein